MCAGCVRQACQATRISPRVHNFPSIRGRGGITPCPRVHLQPPSRSDLHERGFGAPMGMGLSPHDLGRATSEVTADEGASHHAFGCAYSPPHAASYTRGVSGHPWGMGLSPHDLESNLPQPLHYDLLAALRTREAFGTPMATEGLTTCLAKPLHQHAHVRGLCATGLSSHEDQPSRSQIPIHRRCPSTKASNHARGLPLQLPSADAMKAKNAMPVA